MNANPSIELTFEEITGSKPKESSPYVWVVRMADRSGCALDCDYYTPEESPARFKEFLEDAGFSLTRSVYEAVDCKFHGIEGDDAVDAIFMAILRLFENDDCIVENTFYDAPFDVDFTIRTSWDNVTKRFTLHPDSHITFHNN